MANTAPADSFERFNLGQNQHQHRQIQPTEQAINAKLRTPSNAEIRRVTNRDTPRDAEKRRETPRSTEALRDQLKGYEINWGGYEIN